MDKYVFLSTEVYVIVDGIELLSAGMGVVKRGARICSPGENHALAQLQLARWSFVESICYCRWNRIAQCGKGGGGIKEKVPRGTLGGALSSSIRFSILSPPPPREFLPIFHPGHPFCSSTPDISFSSSLCLPLVLRLIHED
ncbi:hypothetical protein CEXT_567921 [Caerostris extrusa]|uniref:Uncharacterized protein n=1 Tax=Caerostris extrusa TaxID=172846 RepID=A0AAV4VZF7_CAEEX|nr:hypothetical protein CEXT_567921 [Caerostris extrusa]